MRLLSAAVVVLVAVALFPSRVWPAERDGAGTAIRKISALEKRIQRLEVQLRRVERQLAQLAREKPGRETAGADEESVRQGVQWLEGRLQSADVEREQAKASAAKTDAGRSPQARQRPERTPRDRRVRPQPQRPPQEKRQRARRVEREAESPGKKAWLGVRLDQDGTVVDVFPDSPAQTADIRPGDVITGLDGSPVEDAYAIVAAVSGKRPGDSVTVELVRGGLNLEVKVVLAEMPD